MESEAGNFALSRSAAFAARPLALRGRIFELRVLLDVSAVAVALAVAFLLRFQLGLLEITESSALTVRAHLVACVLWSSALVIALWANRLYDEDTLFVGGGEFSRILRSTLEATAVLSTFVFVTQSFYVSRSWFAVTVLASAALLIGERLALRTLLRREHLAGRRRRPAVLVSKLDDEWRDWPFEDAHEFEVVGRVDPVDFESFIESGESDALGGDSAIVLRARDFSHDEFWRVLLLSGERRWSVFVHSPVRSVGRDRLTVREVAGQTIVKVAPPVLNGGSAVQKRALDVAISALMLVTLAPLMIAIGIAVLVTSGRPILFLQDRVGRGGKTFRIVKFRTMHPGADERRDADWTTRDDPRRTRFGRWLRRTSVDELPQLWNVLKGEMSLVGPRPERPSLVQGFERDMTWYRFRRRMRPGITGWAQSHGLRGNTSLESRVQYDNWYIENWSVWLDLRILLLTIREIVRGEHAY